MSDGIRHGHLPPDLTHLPPERESYEMPPERELYELPPQLRSDDPLDYERIMSLRKKKS